MTPSRGPVSHRTLGGADDAAATAGETYARRARAGHTDRRHVFTRSAIACVAQTATVAQMAVVFTAFFPTSAHSPAPHRSFCAHHRFGANRRSHGRRRASIGAARSRDRAIARRRAFADPAIARTDARALPRHHRRSSRARSFRVRTVPAGATPPTSRLARFAAGAPSDALTSPS